VEAGSRAIEQSLETIEHSIAWLDANLEPIAQWLAVHA